MSNLIFKPHKNIKSKRFNRTVDVLVKMRLELDYDSDNEPTPEEILTVLNKGTHNYIFGEEIIKYISVEKIK